jgi:hypothetical protein
VKETENLTSLECTQNQRDRKTAQEAVEQKKQKTLKKPSNTEIRYNSNSEKKERARMTT